MFESEGSIVSDSLMIEFLAGGRRVLRRVASLGFFSFSGVEYSEVFHRRRVLCIISLIIPVDHAIYRGSHWHRILSHCFDIPFKIQTPLEDLDVSERNQFQTLGQRSPP